VSDEKESVLSPAGIEAFKEIFSAENEHARRQIEAERRALFPDVPFVDEAQDITLEDVARLKEESLAVPLPPSVSTHRLLPDSPNFLGGPNAAPNVDWAQREANASRHLRDYAEQDAISTAKVYRALSAHRDPRFTDAQVEPNRRKLSGKALRTHRALRKKRKAAKNAARRRNRR
jgi:hypothetical protein